MNCGAPYSMGYWNDGTCAKRKPGVLHDFHNIVYLVSAVYICPNKHSLLAHDEIILQCFPIKSVIPFVLLHKTGFVHPFVEMCASLIRSGMNFNSIEAVIRERRMETYSRQISNLHLYQHFKSFSAHS